MTPRLFAVLTRGVLRLSPFRRLIVAAIGVVALAACGKHADDAAADSTHAEVAAEVATATIQPFTVSVNALGTVQPRPDHVAALSSPGPARVLRVLVAFGAHVHKGDRLIELDPAPFQAAVESADATLEVTRLALDRAQRLVDEGIAARKDLEQAQGEYSKAKSESRLAHRNADLAVLRSPIDGVVTKLDATMGGSVDTSQPLIEIADPASADVLLTVTTADAAGIRVGDRVSFTAGSASPDSAVATGVIADVSGTVDSSSHGVGVRAQVTASRRPLRMGESVSAAISAAVHARAVTVPTAALVPEGDGYKVFVVDSASVAHATAVTVGAKTASLAEIVKGLAGGERIVTNGAFGVEDGAKITPPKP